ncbi:sensor histidine kinase [Actinoplanes sp. HUAS TT8]|uniref:sensor histidine kinase n=1 Tax=Actinoplanes sp. HUAS TT8 TaxID=3447453 RepID=UPI003F52004F
MPRRLTDVVVVGAALLAGAATIPHPSGSRLATALLSVAAAGLWWRRRHAVPVFVVAVAGNVVHLLATTPGTIPVDVVTVLSAYAVAAHARAPHRVLWPALALPALVLGLVKALDGVDHAVLLGLAAAFATIGAPWLAGDHVRTRKRLAVDAAASERAAAVAEERSRIARELHDSVAHHVSVMGMQAGAARLTLDADPGRAREALLAIEAAGREAVDEMRQMLNVLRAGPAPAAPQPDLAALPALADSFRAAGLPLRLDVHGDPAAVPAAVQLSAYRIVEQSLTNVLEHAGPAATTARVTVDDAAVEIVVDNNPPVTASRGGGGYGTIGMRERAALFHGTLESGPRPDGGYRVTARLLTTAGA